MRTLLLVLAASFLLPLAPHAAAGDCEAGLFATGEWEFTGGSASTTWYLDDRDYVTGNGFWIYEETNGIWSEKLPGVYANALGYYGTFSDLQRGGSSPLVPGDNEICTDDSPAGPDQLVF
jgi:hypothetical protein